MEGSFPWAVAQANGDPSIDTIVFAAGLDIELTEAVTYIGTQDLAIDGNGSTLRGAGTTPTRGTAACSSPSATPAWISELSFVDSFNNGLAVSAGRVVRRRDRARRRHRPGRPVPRCPRRRTADHWLQHRRLPAPLVCGPPLRRRRRNITFEISDSQILDNGRIDGFDITQAMVARRTSTASESTRAETVRSSPRCGTRASTATSPTAWSSTRPATATPTRPSPVRTSTTTARP